MGAGRVQISARSLWGRGRCHWDFIWFDRRWSLKEWAEWCTKSWLGRTWHVCEKWKVQLGLARRTWKSVLEGQAILLGPSTMYSRHHTGPDRASNRQNPSVVWRGAPNFQLCWPGECSPCFDFGLEVLSGVAGLHVEGDVLASECLHKDLHCHMWEAAVKGEGGLGKTWSSFTIKMTYLEYWYWIGRKCQNFCKI